MRSLNSSKTLSLRQLPLVQIPYRACALRSSRVMGDHKNGFVELAVQAMHQFEHLFGRSLVEIARRLIGDQDRRVRSDSPSDGNALFLATGKLAREMVHTF